MAVSVSKRDIRRVTDMQAVYRMYDDAGALLYVGTTVNVDTRLKSHAEKRWFPLVAAIKLEWFDTAAAAFLAEQRAIRAEQPRMNVSGKRGPRPRRPKPKPPIEKPRVVPIRPTEPCTLTVAAQTRVVPFTPAALRMRRFRDPKFPKPVGSAGTAHLYDPAELAAWDEARRS